MSEPKTTRKVPFSVTNIHLMIYGIYICPDCGEEIVDDWGSCYNGCDPNDDNPIRNHQREEVRKLAARQYNTLAISMFNSRIDWDDINLEEWIEEFGSMNAVADMLGVSESSVRRQYRKMYKTENSLNRFG